MCRRAYIPIALRRSGRPDVNQFTNGDILFRREKNGEHISKFPDIELYDISVNRQKINDFISEKDDVLWNTDGDESFERYDNYQVIELVITSISEDNTIFENVRNFDEDESSRRPYTIKIKHDSTECNYFHSEILVSVDGELLNETNYEEKLGHKRYKAFRRVIRAQLKGLLFIG